MCAAVGFRIPRARSITSTAGLILFDEQHRIVYKNSEALRILTYPDPLKKGAADPPSRTLHSLLQVHHSPRAGTSSTDFKSGRRRYVSKFFVLVPGAEKSGHASAGILLERAAPRVMDVSAVSRQFGLTRREEQTVELLTLGLTSKEIASRMNISPNTVKAFFRMVMTKMAVSTRSGIVGKIARMRSLA
jgi:DNA-binding CsgD family transcriptional regulator